MSLHVASAGQGRDLVLIHGWGMHGGVWQDVAHALAPHCRVHAVDLPGMGDSPPCRPGTAAQVMAELIGVLPERATVCGWSLGGQLAMRLALQCPERVGRLVLVGATPRFVNGDGWEHGVTAAVFREFAAQVMQDPAAAMGRFLSLQAMGGTSSRELIRALRARFALKPALHREALQAALDMLLEADLRDAVAGMAQPALVLHGERDTLAPVAAARWLAARLPQAQLAVIGGASHAPFLSHPVAFVARLRAFLES